MGGKSSKKRLKSFGKQAGLGGGLGKWEESPVNNLRSEMEMIEKLEQPVSAKEGRQVRGRVQSRRRGHRLPELHHRQYLEGQKLPFE